MLLPRQEKRGPKVEIKTKGEEKPGGASFEFPSVGRGRVRAPEHQGEAVLYVQAIDGDSRQVRDALMAPVRTAAVARTS